MRNVAFLALGLALLRAPGERVSRSRRRADLARGRGVGRGRAPRLRRACCGKRAARPAGPARSPRSGADFVLPATVLLGYTLLVSLGHTHVGRPIPALVLPAHPLHGRARVLARARRGRRLRPRLRHRRPRDRPRGPLHLHLRGDVRPRARRGRAARRADDVDAGASRGRLHAPPEHDGARAPRHLRARRVGAEVALPAGPPARDRHGRRRAACLPPRAGASTLPPGAAPGRKPAGATP